jgi:ABC-type nitrate/sulfonate/bicarbonate transport system permease component
VNQLLLPPPDRVVLSISDIGIPIVLHFLATTARVLAGFAGAVVLGSAVGLSMQYSRACFAVMDGIVETSRPVPPVALAPFFILIFGFSETGRFLLVVLGAALVIVVTVVEATERVPSAVIRLGLTSGLSRRELFSYVVIPAAISEAKAGFRIALALSITLVIVSEFLGSRYGLGYLINVSKVTLTTPTILLCIILLGFMGFLLDCALRLLFDYATRWNYSSREVLR